MGILIDGITLSDLPKNAHDYSVILRKDTKVVDMGVYFYTDYVLLTSNVKNVFVSSSVAPSGAIIGLYPVDVNCETLTCSYDGEWGAFNQQTNAQVLGAISPDSKTTITYTVVWSNFDIKYATNINVDTGEVTIGDKIFYRSDVIIEEGYGKIKRQTMRTIVEQARRLSGLSDEMLPSRSVDILKKVNSADELILGQIVNCESNVASVRNYAFYECTALHTVNLPNVTQIGDYAFYGCTSMREIAAPVLTKIGDNAFQGSALNNVNLPLVQRVGSYAFRSSPYLTSVNLPLATAIFNSAFNSCTTLESVYLPKLTKLYDYTFYNCGALKNVNIPLLSSINESAFDNCVSLTTIDLPNVTTIGESAFLDCDLLESVNVPKATNIGNYAFRNCISLKNIKLQSVTSIGTNLFESCTALEVVDFAKPVTITQYAFRYCTALKALILRSETQCPLQIANAISTSSIGSGTGYIYVPSALIDSYKTASYWKNYPNQFRAIEDYTVDGTRMGELDWSKIETATGEQ